MRITTRLLALALLASCLWFFAATPVGTQQITAKRSLPVEARQLEPVGGILQVEVRCDDAKLSGTGRIDEASCVIKNNTLVAMVAGTIKISITLDEGGTTNLISSYETFDTFLHSDVREDHETKLIQPGMLYRFGLMPANFGVAIVRKLEAEVDYIEFVDKTRAGPDRVGSRTITDIREGAAKYKNWLVRKYKENGASANAIVELLDKDPDTRSSEIGLLNSDQSSGASMYRNFARRANGYGGLTKHLKVK